MEEKKLQPPPAYDEVTTTNYHDRFKKALNDVITREKQKEEKEEERMKTSASKLLDHALRGLESGRLDRVRRDDDGATNVHFRFMFKWSENKDCESLKSVPDLKNNNNRRRVNDYLRGLCGQQLEFYLQVEEVKERLVFVLRLKSKD